MSFFLNYVVVSKVKHVPVSYEQIFSFPIVLVFDLSSHEKEEKKLQKLDQNCILLTLIDMTFERKKNTYL